MILGEEFGEACAAAHDTLYDVADKANEDHLDAELVQVAAVAIAWLEERRLGMSMCKPEFRHDYSEDPQRLPCDRCGSHYHDLHSHPVTEEPTNG